MTSALTFDKHPRIYASGVYRNDKLIGEIRWLVKWDNYAFFPLEDGIGYDASTLGEIAIKLDDLTEEREQNEKAITNRVAGVAS